MVYPAVRFKSKFLKKAWKILIPLCTILISIDLCYIKVPDWKNWSGYFRTTYIFHHTLFFMFHILTSIKFVSKEDTINSFIDRIKWTKYSKIIFVSTVGNLTSELLKFLFRNPTLFDTFCALRLQLLLLLMCVLIWEATNDLVLLNKDLKHTTYVMSVRRILVRHNLMCNHINAINEVFGGIIAVLVGLSLTVICQPLLFDTAFVSYYDVTLAYLALMFYLVCILLLLININIIIISIRKIY